MQGHTLKQSAEIMSFLSIRHEYAGMVLKIPVKPRAARLTRADTHEIG
jgi:hypothetical protein